MANLLLRGTFLKASKESAMNNAAKADERTPEEIKQEKKREEKHHEKAVEDTFPASDPPATSQPGSGITGPEVVEEKKKG